MITRKEFEELGFTYCGRKKWGFRDEIESPIDTYNKVYGEFDVLEIEVDTRCTPHTYISLLDREDGDTNFSTYIEGGCARWDAFYLNDIEDFKKVLELTGLQYYLEDEIQRRT